MNPETTILLVTAASLGFVHTVLGPDHYIPFIVMSKASKWSKFKTIWITVLSGIGHVLSSVALGCIGIVFGFALHEVVAVESYRGEIAGWLMITFGLLYFIWGLKRAFKKKSHHHFHLHDNEDIEHKSSGDKKEQHHAHEKNGVVNLTPWIIFTIFVFGPCEVLIPLLMYPAANESIFSLVLVIFVFGTATILTMLTIVLIGSFGFDFLPLGKVEKYTHALAGLFIFLSGAAIRFLGL